jgi:hypothetical protein
MKFNLFAAITATVLLSGCANLLSIHRQNNITPATSGKANPGAEITLIDAKQRAVISVQRGNKTVVCAEPSPDGLQAVASSTAFTLQEAEGRLANIANSLSEAATNIGLRTQSIQLLRDGMYRICEGYAAHAIGDDEVTMLHRRAQNLMLGLLAIEQLTGAVTNSQVALHTGGSASAGAAAGELSALQSKLKVEQDALVEAARLLQVAQGEQKSTNESLKKKQDSLAKLKPDQTKEAEPLKGEIEALISSKNIKDAEVVALDAKRNNQAALVRSSQEAVTAASGRVSASTASLSSVIDGRTGRGLNDPETAKAVSNAVVDIVTQIVTTSFNHDACFGIIDKLANTKVEYPSHYKNMVEACLTMFTAEIKEQAQLRTESIQRRAQNSDTTKKSP